VFFAHYFVELVSETEEIPGAKDVKPLPPEIDKPYEVYAGKLRNHQLELVIENAKRDGVRIKMTSDGSQSAGRIRGVSNHQPLDSQNVLSGYKKTKSRYLPLSPYDMSCSSMKTGKVRKLNMPQ